MNITLTSKSHFIQIIQYFIVGITAALIHFTCAVVLIAGSNIHPLSANCIAFVIAFQVSYFGHKSYTFNCPIAKISTTNSHILPYPTTANLNRRLNNNLFNHVLNKLTSTIRLSFSLSISKYFMVAVSGFILNEYLFNLSIYKLHLNYQSALILAIAIVPVFTFVFSKLWAFKTTRACYDS